MLAPLPSSLEAYLSPLLIGILLLVQCDGNDDSVIVCAWWRLDHQRSSAPPIHTNGSRALPLRCVALRRTQPNQKKPERSSQRQQTKQAIIHTDGMQHMRCEARRLLTIPWLAFSSVRKRRVTIHSFIQLLSLQDCSREAGRDSDLYRWSISLLRPKLILDGEPKDIFRSRITLHEKSNAGNPKTIGPQTQQPTAKLYQIYSTSVPKATSYRAHEQPSYRNWQRLGIGRYVHVGLNWGT